MFPCPGEHFVVCSSGDLAPESLLLGMEKNFVHQRQIRVRQGFDSFDQHRAQILRNG